MIKTDFIRTLKKNNISENAEATMQRIKEVWAPLKKPVRDQILALADMKKVSVERAYKTGGASAKVIISIAQILDIDPLYLMGEAKEKGTFNNDRVIKLLQRLGYDVDNRIIGRRRKLAAEATPAASPAAAPVPAAAAAAKEQKVGSPGEGTMTKDLSKLLNEVTQAKL
ncbi:MAG: hypothetical protein LBI27_06780, partial [Clostridiales bacterium]|nr:hypothetical protein [Clostridiales bacterium]